MIRFKCCKCGYEKDASDKYEGKHVRCPKCKAVNIVRRQGTEKAAQPKKIIKFYCPKCGQKIGVSEEYAGKKARCAKCKNLLEVPGISEEKRRQPAKEAESILRAGGQDFDRGEAGDKLFANMGDLLQMEEEAYKLERLPEPAKDEQAFLREPTINIARQGSSVAFSSYEEGEEKPKKTKLLLIIGSAGLGIILLVVFALSLFRGSDKKEVDYYPAEQFSESYMNLLVSGNIEQAWELASKEVKEEYPKEDFESIGSFFEDSKGFELKNKESCILADSGQYAYGFSYNAWSSEKQREIFIVLEPIDETFCVQGIIGQEEGDEDTFGRYIAVVSGRFDETAFRLQNPAIFGILSWITPTTMCFMLTLFLILAIFVLISMCIVYSKAGQPAWAPLVPIYNLWVLAEIADKPGWLGVIVFLGGMIPFVGWLVQGVLMLIILIGVAKTFDRSVGFGIGLFFLPFIFYPILAFSRD